MLLNCRSTLSFSFHPFEALRACGFGYSGWIQMHSSSDCTRRWAQKTSFICASNIGKKTNLGYEIRLDHINGTGEGARVRIYEVPDKMILWYISRRNSHRKHRLQALRISSWRNDDRVAKSHYGCYGESGIQWSVRGSDIRRCAKYSGRPEWVDWSLFRLFLWAFRIRFQLFGRSKFLSNSGIP